MTGVCQELGPVHSNIGGFAPDVSEVLWSAEDTWTAVVAGAQLLGSLSPPASPAPDADAAVPALPQLLTPSPATIAAPIATTTPSLGATAVPSMAGDSEVNAARAGRECAAAVPVVLGMLALAMSLTWHFEHEA